MQRLFALLCSLFAAIGLPGCDYFNLQELKPGVTTALEVRDRMGPPEMEWPNDDGSVTWEYSRQPEGRQCYMITIGTDNILRSVDEVLNEAGFARVKRGMTGDEVRRVLGKPASRQFFNLSQEHVWSWRIAGDGTLSDPQFFTAHFSTEGRLMKTGRHVEYRGN